MAWRIFDPEKGWIAVFALLLSSAHAGWDLYVGMKGPKPSLLAPGIVFIRPELFPSGYTFVRLAVPMRYVNEGPEQKRVVVTEERLTYHIGEESFTQEWQAFVNFKGKGCNPEVEDDEDPSPLVLPGNDGKSHTTYFSPRSVDGEKRYKNFLTWEEFLGKVKGVERVVVEIRVDIVSREPLTHRCEIEVNDDLEARLSTNCSQTVACRPMDT